MSKTLTPLLAGAAALTLVTGAGVAVAQSPQDAALQAAEDARSAAAKARESGREARDAAREARHKALDEADAARHHAHVYRGVFHGGDREEHLRTMLQLRANQEPALKTYLEAVDHGGRHGDPMVRFDRRGDSARTTTERLAEMEAKMAEQQAAMRRRIDATKAFYGQLDEKQKKVFDAMPMLMFAGPGFGPMLLPVMHRMPPIPEPPVPPAPPVPPRL